MNTAHLHLMVNHLPIVGLCFAILLNFLAVFVKNDELKKLSCWFFILVGLLSVLPILTGDGAHEIAATYPGINNDRIENHETFAYIFFYGLLMIGLLGIAALWYSRKNAALLKKFNRITLVVALLLMILAYQTGKTGGNIRHPEIELGVYKK
jgi:uncharacterized membrane protein